ELREELRKQAIACLTLPDLGVGKEWDSPVSVPVSAWFDDKLEHAMLQDTLGNLRIFRMTDNKKIFQPPETGWPLFSGNGQFLATVTQNHHVELWHLAESPVAVIPNLAGRSMTFSRDSRKFAVEHNDGSISIYELPSGQRLRLLPATARPEGGGGPF